LKKVKTEAMNEREDGRKSIQEKRLPLRQPRGGEKNSNFVRLVVVQGEFCERLTGPGSTGKRGVGGLLRRKRQPRKKKKIVVPGAQIKKKGGRRKRGSTRDNKKNEGGSRRRIRV